jgi:hypothetical protein
MRHRAAATKGHDMVCVRRLVQGLLQLALIVIALSAPPALAQLRGVVVNGVELDARSIAVLESSYRTRLVPGHYWYDRRSGLWGLEGGPSQGQIVPGLALGGALHPRASVGRSAGVTGVFVNGREIHPRELGYLQGLYGPMRPARFWLDARGIGGYEGGPAQFDLRAQAMKQQRQAGYTRRGSFGNTGSDGTCSYFNDPSSGASVMTGC